MNVSMSAHFRLQVDHNTWGKENSFFITKLTCLLFFSCCRFCSILRSSFKADIVATMKQIDVQILLLTFNCHIFHFVFRSLIRKSCYLLSLSNYHHYHLLPSLKNCFELALWHNFYANGYTFFFCVFTKAYKAFIFRNKIVKYRYILYLS